MFETLGDRLGNTFDRLRGKGAITEADVAEAAREIRRALLEADVALPVAKDFIEKVKTEAVGEKVIKAVKPGEQIVKIVHDALVETFGAEPAPLNYTAEPVGIILMVGLQGSGKTTTTGKIGKFLTSRKKAKVLMASLDTQRPAAQEQLATLGTQVGVDTLEIVKGQTPEQITKRALKEAKAGGYDTLILDTAGRLHINEELMNEVAAVNSIAAPTETLLVVDAMTGQDAVNIAQNFHDKIGITGCVMTRIDGDARGGAALSMRAVTGQPIKLLGSGEKLDALEEFDAERIAGRILGMGDVVALVEKASEELDMAEAEKMAARMDQGKFDMNDLLSQLKNMQRMGGMSGIMGMMPGMGKLKKAMASANVDDSVIKKQEAMILSMTKQERAKPEVIKASRRQRIAAGSGTSVPEVNKLLKSYAEMAKMMKKMKKMGGIKGLMSQMGGGGMPNDLTSGLPADADPQELLKKMSGENGDMPKLPPGFKF